MPTVSSYGTSASGVVTGPTRGRDDASSIPKPPRALSLDECRWLLTTDMIGRISYTAGALPAVSPVTYVTDGAEVIIRIEAADEVLTAIRGQVVTLQVDHVSRDGLDGWQVTVTGIAQIARPDDWRTLWLTSAIMCGHTVQLA